MKSLMDKKNLTIIAGVIVVLGVAVFMFMRGSAPEGTLTQTGSGVPTSNSPQAVTVEFVALLSRINNVSFNLALFDNPTFAGLSSISQPIAPLPLGREDPFAPLTPGAE